MRPVSPDSADPTPAPDAVSEVSIRMTVTALDGSSMKVMEIPRASRVEVHTEWSEPDHVSDTCAVMEARISFIAVKIVPLPSDARGTVVVVYREIDNPKETDHA